ncbi:hypothetical protein H0E87_018381 [Populus deltoides]|uniref:Uncharacterized protein n=1 Tax=Populus deltoides TaxID=3696 RepID=A0A8T2XPW5_POPDE|nr:hypothetical protein H0E87_018381 [Populus deltoides]
MLLIPIASAPPRTTFTLADVVNSNCEARVCTKHRKRAIQRPPLAAPPPSSSKPCEHLSTSPVSIRPHCGPSVETDSLSSWFGTGTRWLELLLRRLPQHKAWFPVGAVIVPLFFVMFRLLWFGPQWSLLILLDVSCLLL